LSAILKCFHRPSETTENNKKHHKPSQAMKHILNTTYACKHKQKKNTIVESVAKLMINDSFLRTLLWFVCFREQPRQTDPDPVRCLFQNLKCDCFWHAASLLGIGCADVFYLAARQKIGRCVASCLGIGCPSATGVHNECPQRETNPTTIHKSGNGSQRVSTIN